MQKFIAFIFLFLIASTSIAEENVCPTKNNEPWDKMKEVEFSKEKVNAYLIEFQK